MTPDWSWFHYLIARLAWPSYDCEQCVGQDPWQGCYCYYHEAAGPCYGPTGWHLFWRKIDKIAKSRNPK